MSDLGLLAGRILIAALFLISGVGKFLNYEGTQIYMDIMGLPGGFLPFILVLEIGGSLCLIAGFFLRTFAVLLAIFCLITAGVFHMDFTQSIEVTSFIKNLAIAGGLLILASTGTGRYRLTIGSGKHAN